MPEETTKGLPDAWAVKFADGVSIEIRDLPVGRLASIARNTGHSLVEVVGGPFLGDAEQLEPIIRLAAEWIGPTATVPDPLTFKVAVELMEPIWDVDDLPEPEGKSDADPPTGSAT